MAKTNSPNAQKPLYKKWWFWLIVIAIAVGVIGGQGGSKGSSSSKEQKSESSQADMRGSTTVKETEKPVAYDSQKVYDEAKNALYGLSFMEYGTRELDSSIETVLSEFVPKDVLTDWDKTFEYISSRTQEYLAGIDSLDDIFNSQDDDYKYIRTLLQTALINSTDKDIKNYYKDIDAEDLKELVKQLSKATNFYYCTTDDLIDDLDGNALKAKEKYKDSVVIVKGKLSNIDSNGKYIDITSLKKSYDFTIIQCYIKTKTVKDSVLELSKGENLIAIGVVSDVGEVLGYSINTYTIY